MEHPPSPSQLNHHWRLFDDVELEELRSAAVSLLCRHGFAIHHSAILERLEKQGIKVDTAAQRAWPTPAQVEQVEEAARSNAPQTKEEALLRRSLPLGESIGHNMTLYYDVSEGRRRAASLEDIIRVTKAWHMLPEILHTGPCMTAQDVPTPIEPVVSAAEVMQITHKIRACPELILAPQLPYLEELETIMTGETVLYHTNGCSLTRFTIDSRAADCLAAVAANGLEHWWVNSVPILGMNAPVTLAGGMVYAIAETLGGWLAGWAMNPQAALSAIPLSGMVDMRTGRILFSSPEAVLLDCGLYQYFYAFYRICIGLCSGYTDAKIPGMQAINDKLLKGLAYGWLIDTVGGQAGTLEAGNVYCPTQQVIDLELNRQVHQLSRGIPVSPERICVEEMLDMLAHPGQTFLTHPNTLAHMRDELWMPRLFDRTAYTGDVEEQKKRTLMIDRAEARWQNALASYRPDGVDPDKARAAREVARRARAHLLSNS